MAASERSDIPPGEPPSHGVPPEEPPSHGVPSEEPPSRDVPPAPDVFEGETFYVDQSLRQHLLEMGYSATAADKSIVSGCINLETCLAWLQMHQGMAELEDPLPSTVRVLVKVKRQLSAEEREAAVQQLREKARAAKEKEELAQQQRAVETAKAQREALKGMREQQALADAQRRDRVQEEERQRRQRDAQAREAIQLRLKVDRWVRMGKSQEEATALAQREILQAKAAPRPKGPETPAPAPVASPPPSDGSSEGWALHRLLADGPSAAPDATTPEAPAIEGPPTEATFRALRRQFAMGEGVAVLDRMVTNIIEQPLLTKMRNVRLDSAVASRYLMPMRGAIEFLRLCGFERGAGTLVMNVVVLRRLRTAQRVLRESN